MATHSSIHVWKILWTENPGRLQFMGSQWVRQAWETKHTHTSQTDILNSDDISFEHLYYIFSLWIIVSRIQKILEYYCLLFRHLLIFEHALNAYILLVQEKEKCYIWKHFDPIIFFSFLSGEILYHLWHFISSI